MTRTAPWLIGLGLFGYPIWAGTAAIVAPSAGSLGGIAHRGVVALLALTVVASVWRGRMRLARTDFWWVLGLFMAAMSVRMVREFAVGSIFPLQADPVRVVLLFFGAVVFPVWAFASIPTSDPEAQESRQKALWVVCAATIVAAMAGLVLARGYSAMVQGRASTENINPILIGHLGVSCIVLCLFTPIKHPLGWVFRLGMSGLSVAMIALSGSRGPFLALSILAAVYGVRFLILRGRLWAPIWPALLVGLASIPLILETPLLANTPLAKRIALSSVINARQVGRSNLIPASIEEFWKDPLLGSGLSEKVTYQYPHNSILEAFMSLGVLGGALFVFILGYGLFKALKLIFSHDPWCWVGFIFVQYAIYGLLSSSIYLLDVFWFVLALTVAATTIQRQQPEPE